MLLFFKKFVFKIFLIKYYNSILQYLYSLKEANLIPKILHKIHWLKSDPNIIKNILRGIERETLRVNLNGAISNHDHPYNIGSALTHKWITTDFSESLLEFITPPTNNINYLLYTLRDIHKFVSHNINEEYLWPFSMPPYTDSHTPIMLAKYGKSNIGKVKTLYRTGLKNRYGALMNIISGVHYNFSLPINFWKEWRKNNKIIKKNYISDGYLCLIRNFYRFGWIIPYLFGASPAIESFFVKNKKTNVKFNNKNNMLYLPWSTSLRLSHLGHTNNSIKNLNLTFNSLNNYISSLKYGIQTPSKEFKKLGLIDSFGNPKQININILQTENELYTHIRPKRTLTPNETILDSLNRKGIQYVEIRSLDVNPFSCIGIEKSQILLLDLFLIWCVIADSPKMTNLDLQLFSKNWDIISLEGRKPKQKVYINTYNQQKTLESIGKYLIENFFYIAEILDYPSKSDNYQNICQQIFLYFDHTDLTYSERILNKYILYGINNIGMKIAIENKNKLNAIPLRQLNESDFINETYHSHKIQKEIESHDMLSSKKFF
ncbi:glutamate--cysteine ligase [Buchnera aphidicola (Melaphis rhois)]|uniref:Glutamate--cysteine ligase n=1 Tax=Buchnera aphidicola subsp. Melaphis rhois TaxID=118103 RepID=A0A4D6YAK2_BUCMH|nr:glutamate--cysteine ligase [Buchnera aphidicola (Melaphis rhois)]